MARSKSKHIRLKNRRATQYKKRMKRRKADAKAAPKAPAKKPAPARRAEKPAAASPDHQAG
jgi:hypothetical protein